jgi:dienelactone hydrolase
MTIRTQPVAYGPGDQFEGLVAFDDAWSGPRPGVLVFHSALGRSLHEDEVVEDLARLGYVGFSVDLYGKGVRPSDTDEGIAIARKHLADPKGVASRRDAAVEALLDHPATDRKRFAAIGFCLGGRIVLDLARSGSDVAGVVSLHGGLLPTALPTMLPIRAKMLVLHGWDDPYIPPEQVLAFAKEMTEAGADWQIHAYGRTGHAFHDRHEPHKEEHIGYQPDAARRAWKSLSEFLAELFT